VQKTVCLQLGEEWVKYQHACKGQGFLELTRAQCDAAKAKANEQKPGISWNPSEMTGTSA
jgi:hypothetical protein